jgi:hypothetical protein
MKFALTPPHKLVDAWGDKYEGHMPEWVLRHVAAEAAQWGADQELEACCEHIRNYQWGFVDLPDGTKMHRAVHLELARRPKPLSLKEQALAVLGEWSASEFRHVDVENKICADMDTIRRALEALPND